MKTYYHWHQQGIDFIYLDNATADEFDPGQITWFEKILAADKQDGSTKAVVLGMHAALPKSSAAGHSMNNWRVGETAAIGSIPTSLISAISHTSAFTSSPATRTST